MPLQMLSDLFGDIPDDQYYYLWTLPYKKTYWYQGPDSIETAAGDAANMADAYDVYVGVSLTDKAYGISGRARADTSSGIVALWADVDIKHSVHSKGNLPRTKSQAVELLQGMGLEPSLTILSGHGLHAWWYLDEPWVFENEDERSEAAKLAAAWIYTLKARAKDKGWDLDSTISLSQVLRVANTKNHKEANNAKAVIILERTGARYSPDDFRNYVREEAWEKVESGTFSIDGAAELGILKLDPQAQFNFDKWNVLYKNSANFKKSWEHKRRDLQDQSASSYDLSLATIALREKWTDQEIVNLLIAHRRNHNENLKLREDYYRRTLIKAKKDIEPDTTPTIEDAHKKLQQVQEDDTVSEDQKRDSALNELKKTLGIPEITRVVKFLSDPPVWEIETETGRKARFEVTEDLQSQRKVRARLAEATNKIMARFNNKTWDEISQWILYAAEPVSTGDENTMLGGMKSEIYAYFEDHIPQETKDREQIHETINLRQPVIIDGKIHIFLDDFMLWMKNARGNRNAQKRSISATLKTMGCDSVILNTQKKNKKHSTRSSWRLPGPPEDWTRG